MVESRSIFHLTTDSPAEFVALANTMGSANAEMTIPVVRNVQNSLSADEVDRSSEFLLAIRVGSGARK